MSTPPSQGNGAATVATVVNAFTGSVVPIWAALAWPDAWRVHDPALHIQMITTATLILLPLTGFAWMMIPPTTVGRSGAGCLLLVFGSITTTGLCAGALSYALLGLAQSPWVLAGAGANTVALARACMLRRGG